MELFEKMLEIIDSLGFDYVEKVKTIYTTCPSCGKDDKFSILKANGSCICYRGSCDFGQQWFADWISLTAKIPLPAAKRMISDHSVDHSTNKIELSFQETEKPNHTINPTVWPVPGFVKLSDLSAVDGVKYLASRGIDVSVAMEYDIMYSPLTRRIVFPVKMKGVCYGWQARAIDKVDSADRMRNNTDFPRAFTLMFYDQIKTAGHIIVAEGPVDAIKFNKVHGNVATMGKVVTSHQIELINKSGAHTLYLAMDPDAANEMRDLASKVNMPVKIIELPDSCIQRCQLLGKKADFGECTFDEAERAFYDAKDFGSGYLLVHFN